MNFLRTAATNVAAEAAANFKSIMGIFGSRSTKDTPSPPVLQAIQEEAKKIKSGVDTAPPQTLPLVPPENIIATMTTIATLNAVNDSIECKGPGLASATPSTVDAPTDAVQMNSFAVNSVQIDDLLEGLQVVTEIPYKENENRLFEASLAAFMTHQRDEENYRTESKACVTDELTDMLMGCFIGKDEAIEPHKLEASPASIYSRCAELAALPSSSVSQFTDSWLSSLELLTPRSTDRVKYKENEKFFKRTACCLQALRAYTIFESVDWRLYKKSQQNSSMPGGPPGGPADYGYDLREIFQPYRYVIGPIVDFESLEGRTLIYVKCYDDATYTTGIYFWVYLSQSEGLFRVFFKLLANSIIEKGFDYTQGTLVNFMLQCLLTEYYNRHYRPGKQNPIKINSLERVVYFVQHMPYLQSNFLTNFPQNPPPSPAQCYVTPGQPGYVGHYYLIDKKYNSIFHNGFPLTQGAAAYIFGTGSGSPPSDDMVFWQNLKISNPNLFLDVCRPPIPEYTFDKTEPLIYCFTTSCPKTIITSFQDLLNVMNYTATVWFQGLQNFTRMFGILSPVLYIIMGAMLESPDFEFSSYKYDMLGVPPAQAHAMHLERPRHYKNSLNMLVTLGTEQLVDTTLHLPGIDTLPRAAALNALGKFAQPGATFARRDMPTLREDIASQQALVLQKATEIYENLIASGLVAPLAGNADYMERYKQFLINEISDFGLLSIKRKWFFQIFDASYQARDSVFPMNPSERINVGAAHVPRIILYCLCKNCKFLPLPDLNCLDPSDHRLKTLTSQFNETRRDHTSINPNEVNVIVLTLSQHYCMEVKYNKLDSRGHSEIRTMCRLIQVSSTIVYKSGDPEINKILFSIDMQQTPIACFPDYIIETTTEEEVLAYIRNYRQGGGTLPKGAKGTKGTKDTKGTKGNPEVLPKQPAGAAVASPVPALVKPEATSKLPAAAARAAADLQRQATAAAQAAAEHERQSAAAAQAAAEHERQSAAAAQAAADLQRQAAAERERQMGQVLYKLKLVLESKMTLFLTPKRVASWGSFFAGKMMDYLFGPYFQLPTIFKRFEQYLQVCHAYYTTALIYNYNTARPDSFLVVNPAFSFVGMFVAHFGTSFVPPETGLTAAQYIGRHLRENTMRIQQIAQILTAPFMDDHDMDDVSVASSAKSSDTSSVASSASSSFPAAWQLLGDSLGTDGSDRTFQPSQDLGSQGFGSQGTADGGSLLIKNRIKKSITTHKNKNKNKNKNPTRRGTFRIKRMIKSKGSKVTRNTTCKQRAPGGKRKSKPNKTMRRYRRVRK